MMPDRANHNEGLTTNGCRNTNTAVEEISTVNGKPAVIRKKKQIDLRDTFIKKKKF